VVADFHLGEDGSAIVGNCNVAVGRDEDLVQTAGPERGFNDRGDGAGGLNVLLDSFCSVCSLLLALITYNDEGSAGLVLGDLRWEELDRKAELILHVMRVPLLKSSSVRTCQ
jgi:hypothetical protein